MEANKYGLALHTTTTELGLAISNFAEGHLSVDSRSQTWNLDRELSSHLHQYLMDFIKPQTWQDMAFIAVAKGPGGFTGTRIGMVAARTLGQQLNIPVFAISTLAAVAWNQRKEENIHIAVQMPAQRGQVFGAIYQPAENGLGLTTLLTDTALLPEAWQEKLTNCDRLGKVRGVCDRIEVPLEHPNYQLIEAKSGLAATVTSLLQLAYFDWLQGQRPSWSEALPFYGQHPVDL
ncbi:tRNA (adenosine(37)-N6)-threonylcarbamoyltransferase complex dimerization subunit type 1 TsaB [Brunnivagina elsteri]|uniref:tRNA (Adenosine(37)-N6)-threonylcarbamoyltransferase complex dimerization subunit type 1 TsaB n=1 Tax=Brunnivagina elsteri CCALA 953 TaxID=987040 RepID=A0A2A2T9E4_9CYAN|nr:tRNA (adenosine(37)-N6)-threonylcarbamoyltransferase complex dimerization subunit type 1 TsaB [Calothrix elsteri]PAX45677.1 tRNA (adenosine(37)-N6)-threonylcarbamoyltransferase complex dimerization subunit type 1 TsaB [Calothrix elsteri CCALA 953]